MEKVFVCMSYTGDGISKYVVFLTKNEHNAKKWKEEDSDWREIEEFEVEG